MTNRFLLIEPFSDSDNLKVLQEPAGSRLLKAATRLASFITITAPHIVRPPAFIHLEYLRQLCLTHPGILYFYSTICHEYILGFYLNQTATGSEKNFESTVTVLSHLWTLPYRSLNAQRYLCPLAFDIGVEILLNL